jgi:hypothetical protein
MTKFVLIFLVFLSFCSPAKRSDEDLDVVIDASESYKFDLKKATYTVYFMSKSPVEVKFSLSKNEKEEISRKYRSLGINNLPPELTVTSNCVNSPTLFTIVIISSKSLNQKIRIPLGCDYIDEQQRGNQIREFIITVTNIVKSKPEVKDAPKSDIVYM